MSERLSRYKISALILVPAISLSAVAFMPANAQSSSQLANVAIEVLRAQCEDGNGPACRELGIRQYANGQAFRAQKMYVMGCDLRDAQSCYDAGLSFSKDEADPHDYDASISYYQKGCDLNFRKACASIASVRSQQAKEEQESGGYVRNTGPTCPSGQRLETNYLGEKVCRWK